MPTSSELVKSTLQTLTNHWLSTLKAAMQYKEKVFGGQAKEAQKYYDGSYDMSDFVSLEGSYYSKPPVDIRFNKVAEVVQLFGPALYHDNPTRVLTGLSLPQIPPQDLANTLLDPNKVQQVMQMAPQMGVDPQQIIQMLQQQAMQQALAIGMPFDMERQQMDSRNKIISLLAGKYLNYTPYELDLRGNSRLAIDEAIVKGAGVMWTSVVTMPLTGQKIVGSFWDSIDRYVHDPDYNLSDDRSKKWIAQLCIQPAWMVEKDYGLPPGSLKPNTESLSSSMTENAQFVWQRQQNNAQDLLCYWKIWSKMGIGDRLPGVDPALRQQFGKYGDYVYLVVTDAYETPLNLQTNKVLMSSDQQIMQATQWPIPFYGDNDWPCEVLGFHRSFTGNYPLSHIRFAIGEIQFMNWVVSMIAMKLNTTSRDLLMVAQQTADEVVQAIKSGGDLTVCKVKTSAGSKLDDMVHFLQAPPMNTDVMHVVPMVMDMLDKRLGTTALLYGESQGILRSASEAEIKNDNSKSRLVSMEKEVNHMSANLAKKEFIAARCLLGPQDLQPIFGVQGTNLWGQFVASADATTIFRQIQVRCEESDTRVPDREKQAQNLKDASQMLLPILAQRGAATGDFGPLNALITEWGATIDMDTTAIQVPSVQPPAAPGQPPTPVPPQAPQTLPANTPVGSSTS